MGGPVGPQRGLATLQTLLAAVAIAPPSSAWGQSMSNDTCTDCGPWSEDALSHHRDTFWCMLRGDQTIPRDDGRGQGNCESAPLANHHHFHVHDNCCYESAAACALGATHYNTELVGPCGDDLYQATPPTATTSRVCVPTTAHPTPHGAGKSKDKDTILVKMSATDDLEIGIVAAVLVLLIVVGAFYWRNARNKANLNGEELELHQLLLTEAGNIMEQYRRAWLISEDDLKLGRLLGKGNFGSVYSGAWLGRQVAVKVLQEQLLDTQLGTNQTGTIVVGASNAFDKEAETMIQLHHPNLVGFFGAGSMDDGSTFLVTEFMARGTLRDILSQNFRGLPWKRKIKFCLDIGSGMLFLHTRSPPMIHRDLKADNVLVSEHYQVKIADFGTAARLRSEGGISQRDVLQGSPLWIAPELLKDDSTSDNVTTANDVYSFAMLLYEVASGFLPFQDAEGNFLYDDNYELYRDVVAGVRPQIPMRCHATLKSLMTKCWESDPARRPDFKYISEQLADADLPSLVVSTNIHNGPAGSYRDVQPLPAAAHADAPIFPGSDL